jgi:predicted Rossmann fold flavoprotein
MAAVAAARAGVSVALVERDARLGKKILATGNGRCNLSNLTIGEAGSVGQYNQPGFVAPALKRYGCSEVRALFEEMGLLSVCDAKGWVFPYTRKANSVLDVLLNEVRRLGVVVHTEQGVQELVLTQDGVFRAVGETICLTAPALVIASGADGPAASLKPHRVVPLTPVLGPLKTEKEPLKGLDGVRASAAVALMDGGQTLSRESGEVLFRDYGISGIVVFNLSRFARPGHEVVIDLMSGHTDAECRAMLERRHLRNPDAPIRELLDGLLHPRLAQAVIRRSGMRATDEAERNMLYEIVKSMKKYRLSVTGTSSKTQAQTFRGGLVVEDFDPTTLQSLLLPRLFAAGECLDVDGPCGGFNLHWAWASGYVAGSGAAAAAADSRAAAAAATATAATGAAAAATAAASSGATKAAAATAAAAASDAIS